MRLIYGRYGPEEFAFEMHSPVRDQEEHHPPYSPPVTEDARRLSCRTAVRCHSYADSR